MALVTKIAAALTHFGLLSPLWTLLTFFINATFGIETEGCGRAFFTCYDDCCLKEDWFCHHKEKRCVNCDIWKALCGNDSVPLGCQLYCYKQQQLPNPCPADADVDNYCIQRNTFVAAVGTLAAVLGIVLAVMVTVCVCARTKTPEQWPAFLRVFLGLNRSQAIFKDGRNEKNPEDTEEGTPMLEEPNPTPKDVDTNSQDTNAKKPSSASLMSQDSSGCPSSTTEDLNLTRVDNGDSGSQGQEADHLDDPPPTMSSNNPEASTSPGRMMANAGPGPNLDFEVGSPGGAQAVGRSVPAGASTLPGTNPPSPQPGHKSGPGLFVNSPNFSTMNPTNEIGRPQNCVVDTGTDNPVRNYDLNLPPVQPTDQY